MSIRNKKGRFNISKELLKSNYKDIKKIMGECVILRCEFLYLMGYFEYHALSEHFEIVKEGEISPLYVATINKDGEVSFDKVGY